jgi:hypothetical protein
MTRSSAARASASTQIPPASRKEPLATLASRVERRVGNVRRALVNGAGKGFASELAASMGWRIERRSRELNGTEKLSIADVAAEIELHLTHGEQEQADAIIAAFIEGLRSSAVPITPGSVIRVFDEGGQLYMRFDR